MTTIALVTLLILIEYSFFFMLTGMARGKTVAAPAVSGEERFERALRVQMNTLEQMVVTIPAMWICGLYFSFNVAAILGLVFIVGRLIYAISYMKEPASRTLGFVVGFFANVGLILCGLYGLISQMV